jgi:glycosyltransferase involved in cell wall biosynthesis
MPPKVSILTTVFNRAHLITETVESLLASRFEDFEALIVDDCSTDASWSVIQNLVRRDARLAAHQNASNLGDYANRAKAVSLARGGLIKFLDADDLIYPHGLGIMVDAMDRYPEAALALSHSAPELERPYPVLLSPGEVFRRQFLGRGALSCGPSGAIFRREAFDSVGGFRDWGVLSDIDLWQRLAARWPVVLLPPALVWWRRHEGQEYTKGNADYVYLARGFALSKETLESDECPLPSGDRHLALARARRHHARRLISHAVKGGHPAQALRLAMEAGLSAHDFLGGLRSYR